MNNGLLNKRLPYSTYLSPENIKYLEKMKLKGSSKADIINESLDSRRGYFIFVKETPNVNR